MPLKCCYIICLIRYKADFFHLVNVIALLKIRFTTTIYLLLCLYLIKFGLELTKPEQLSRFEESIERCIAPCHQ